MNLVLAQLVPLEKLEYARVRGATAKSKWDSVDPADDESTSDSDGCPPLSGTLSLSLSSSCPLTNNWEGANTVYSPIIKCTQYDTSSKVNNMIHHKMYTIWYNHHQMYTIWYTLTHYIQTIPYYPDERGGNAQSTEEKDMAEAIMEAARLRVLGKTAPTFLS